MEHTRELTFKKNTIIYIRIEEQNKIKESKEFNFQANLLEHKLKNSENNKNNHQPRTKKSNSTSMNKSQNTKFKKSGDCFVYRKLGYRAKECNYKKGNEEPKPKTYLAKIDVIAIVISFQMNMVISVKNQVVDLEAIDMQIILI